MTNQIEQEALLEAASEIAESLVASIRKIAARPIPTAVGSQLAAALTLRLLLSQIQGDFINPMWVPGREEGTP